MPRAEVIVAPNPDKFIVPRARRLALPVLILFAMLLPSAWEVGWDLPLSELNVPFYRVNISDAVLLATTFMLLLRANRREMAELKKTLPPYALFCLACLLSYLVNYPGSTTDEALAGLTFGIFILRGFLIALLVVRLVTDMRSAQYALSAFILSVVLGNAWVIYFFGDPVRWIGRGQAPGFSPTAFGAVNLMAVFCTLGLVRAVKKRVVRFLLYGALAEFALGLYLSGTRNAVVMLGLVGSLYFLLVVRSKLVKIAAAIAAVVTLPSWWLWIGPILQEGTGSIYERISLMRDPTALMGYQFRQQLWVEAWGFIRANPLAGVGPNRLGFVTQFRGTGNYHAHSMYLQHAVELGVVALGCVLYLMTAPLWRIWRIRRKCRVVRHADEWGLRPLTNGLALAMLAFLGTQLTDYMGYHFKPTFVSWLILAFLYKVCAWEERLGRAGYQHVPITSGL